MPVNLKNEKSLNRYIENLVYHGEKYEAFKPEQLCDKDFVSRNRDKIVSAMIYQWMKSRVREYLTDKNDVPYLEPVEKAEETDPEWLKKAVAEGRPVYNFNPDEISEDFYNRLNAVRDCFYSSCSGYLDKELTKPKMNLKVDFLKTVHDYSTFEKAIVAADKWHYDLAVKAQKQTFMAEDRQRMENGTEFVMDLGDGFKAVRLMTPEALDAESDKMGHCVGQGGYDRAVRSNAIQIYSIRDEKGEPHVTFEIQNNLVKQCKGKADRSVVKKYLPYVQRFISETGFNPYDDAKNMGMVKNAEGKFVNMYDIPAGTRFKNLDLSNTEVAVLPEGIVVEGLADLSGSQIERLPDDFQTGGTLKINNTKMETLPDGFRVGGSLSAKGSALKSLPEGLYVGLDLDVSDTKVASLPRSFSVKRNIDVSRTPIRDFPFNLKVGGDLAFAGTEIDFLPAGLDVGGSLNAARSGLLRWPENAKIGKDVDLSETPVSKLPDDFNVNGTLRLTHCQVDTLPAGLKVADSLLMSGLRVTSLPEKFKTGGDLDITGTRIRTLPEGLEVGGSLNMRGSSAVSLPSDIRIGKDLLMSASYVETLPDNLKVGRNLDASYSSLKKLPDGLETGGILNIASTSVREIPAGTKAGGSIRVSGSDVAFIAPDIDSKKIEGMRAEQITEAKAAYKRRAALEEIKRKKRAVNAVSRLRPNGAGRE